MDVINYINEMGASIEEATTQGNFKRTFTFRLFLL